MRLKILKLSLLSLSTVIKFVYINKTALVLTFKCLVFILDCEKVAAHGCLGFDATIFQCQLVAVLKSTWEWM